ncbi:AI-2E family transporter [Crocinitomix catalasitica]|uniref:AI-2E family transporter n=1 Tax=Crocinitomix catalasitica TaxID=184607 RepID=UPI0005625D41|nr:AI-2E family transporter [Crocinitomix catalasitica]
MLSNTRTTNILLLIIVIPFVFYLLKILSFIFIPLVFSMFIALLFLPLMRWLQRKRIPKTFSIVIVVAIIIGVIGVGAGLISLTSQEIRASQDDFLAKAMVKIDQFGSFAEEVTGVKILNEEGSFASNFIQKENAAKQISSTLGLIGNAATSVLMTLFFVVLWLAESINVQKLLNNTILRQKHTSIKTFIKIENDLITFIKVKFAVSLFTGIGIGLSCLFFGVSFPIFWGLFAFLINFVQMIGSFISVILLAIFAFVELDPTSTLFFFVMSITGVQIIFGAILEPVFMGKSFSINIITVLVMLMLWGFIWGVPGLIMSIPITVFLKIIFEQFRSTKILGQVISAND